DPCPRHERHRDDELGRNCFRQGAAPGFPCSRQRRRNGDCAARRGRHGAGFARHFRREVPAMSASPRTLTELFFDAVQTFGAHAAAFRYKADGAWRDVTHREAAARVQALSLGLRELGLAAGEKVAILAETRLEWTLTDYACLCARTTDVPIYPTLPANQVEYILRDAGAATGWSRSASWRHEAGRPPPSIPASRKTRSAYSLPTSRPCSTPRGRPG